MWTAKKCTKTRDARAELLFCFFQSILYSCTSRISRLLRIPAYTDHVQKTQICIFAGHRV